MMRHLVLRYIKSLLILLTVALASVVFIYPVPAQESSDLSMSIDIGFDSRCKENHWTQIRAILENNGPDTSGQIEAHMISFSGQRTVYASLVELPGLSRKELSLYVYPDGHRAEVEVFFVVNGRQAAAQTVPLNCSPSNDLLIGLWAASPTAFYGLSDLAPSSRAPALIPIDLQHIPDRAEAMGALDILVIAGVDTGKLNQAQRATLQEWLDQGGRLVVAGGTHWQMTAAGIGELLPLQPVRSVTLPDLNPLGDLAPQEYRSGALDGPAVVATGALSESAQVIVSYGDRDQGNLPLVVQNRLGAGSVYYLAADPSLAPWNSWDGSQGFFRNLLGRPFDLPSWNSGLGDAYSANLAASRIPALDLPSGFLICGFLGFYVLAAGPMNYYVLRKLKRRELAWISVPALVILFSVLSILVGNFMRGGQPVLNKLSIIQVRSGASEAQVDGIIGVFSPVRGTYSLKAGRNYLLHPLSESQSQRDWTLVQAHDGTSIPDLRIEGGSVSVFAMSGRTPAPGFSHTLTLKNGARGSRSLLLSGSITNQSSLILKDALLLAPGGSQALGDLGPGETRQISLQLTQAQQGNISNVNTQNTAANPIPQVYGYEDPTLIEITGSSAYYEDPQAYTRYHLLKAASPSGSSRGGGIYLSGWTDESPLQLGFEENAAQRYSIEATSLYLISLPPTFDLGDEQIILPPAAFSWALLESNSYTSITPYELYGIPGGISLEFWLAQPISFGHIESLIFHLDPLASSTPPQFEAYLWDFQSQDWEQIGELKWGDNDIPNPARFIGTGGRIQLKIDSGRAGSVPIRAADFTLVVER
jgi:hypothetical protein